MSDPDSILEEIRTLYQARRYEDASALADTISHLFVQANPPQNAAWALCESIADHDKRKQPERAIRLYHMAVAGYQVIGSWASGSGDGLVAQANIDRIKNKIQRLENPTWWDKLWMNWF